MSQTVVSGILSLLASTVAPDVGTTLETSVTPVISGGALEGCAINFSAARADTEYRRGEMVLVAGSLNFWVFPGKPPAFSLKVGIKPPGNSSSEFIKPADAYLLNGYTTNAREKVSTVQAETPGFALFGFKVGPEAMKSIENVGETGQLKIGYAMKADGMAAPLTIDLRVKHLDLDNPGKSETALDAPLQWLDCMKEAVSTRS